MMYSVGKDMLVAMYALTLCITMRYYLELLQEAGWNRKAYLQIMLRENLRWLPLLFMLIPAAALFMGYRALGMAMMFVYLLGISFLFGRKKKKEKKENGKKLLGLFLLWGAMWGVLLLGGFGIPKSQIRVMHLVYGVAFLLQPFAAPLLAALGTPAEHRLGKKYIRKSTDLLKHRKGLQIIAVSGSSDEKEMGKILCVLLSGHYRTAAAEETIRTALEAARAIREINDPGLEVLICPMETDSREELEAIVRTLHPEIAIQTSVDFGSLSEETDPSGEHGIRMVNGDDEALRQCVEKDKVLTYGLGENCDIQGRILSVESSGTKFTVSDSGREGEEYVTSLVGEKRIRFLVGAISAARALGMSEKEIRYRMSAVTPSPHLMQLVSVPNAMLLDDSENTDPDQAEEALRALEEFSGERILVTSGFTRLGAIQETANRRVGELAAEVCSRIILVGTDVPYGIRAGILDAGYQPEHLYEVEDKDEATALIRSWPLRGERVILSELCISEQKNPGEATAD